MYGDKDEDGFFWGELNGQAGYIPFNMVSEVELEDEESGSNVTTPSINVDQESTQPPEESPSQEPDVIATPSENLLEEVMLEEGDFEDPRESDNYQLPPRRMVALFDYDPQTLSPNPDSEVRRFSMADLICYCDGLVVVSGISPAILHAMLQHDGHVDRNNYTVYLGRYYIRGYFFKAFHCIL